MLSGSLAVAVGPSRRALWTLLRDARVFFCPPGRGQTPYSFFLTAAPESSVLLKQDAVGFPADRL